jgi:uncharacterized membrane protein
MENTEKLASGEIPPAMAYARELTARVEAGFARLRSLTVAERVAYGSTCIYAVTLASFAVLHYLAFQSQRADLGNMTQAIWSTLHGHPLATTALNGDQITRLGVHVDPFLVLLAPFWWVWSSPLLLVTLQAVAVSAGALPVFWLARKHLGSERVAVHFALAYLLYPATQFNAFTVSIGFHSVSMAVPLLLFAIWYLDEDRLTAFAVVGLLAATTKEEIPLVVGLLGLWYARTKRRWRFGLAVFVLGLALSLFDFLVVIPHFLGRETYFADRYATVGGTPMGVLRTVFTDPLAIVRDVGTTHKLVYVLLLFVPFLCLFLLEPLLALAAAPDFVINLLSTPSQTKIVYHYTAGIIPFIVAGSIFGLARYRRHAPRISLYVLALAAVSALFSPLLVGVQNIPEAFASNPVHRAKANALALVPADVSVAASQQLAAYLSARRRIMIFPFAVREARWVVVDEADPTYKREGWYHHRIALLKHNADWRVVYSTDGVLVFRKLPSAH